MGVVYGGRSPDGRAVAVKVLLALDDAAIAAFDREARLLQTLTQADGFVPVLDAGDEGGRRWLVMPLLEGGTLRERLKRGPLPVGEAVALALRLASSLGRAHGRGIVHRDLKPENVLFTREGTPLVSDLGLAKHFRRDVLGARRSAAFSERG
jgi:serine/threonine protein kinase